MSVARITLCLFVRAPNLGEVKSRLAASIGEPAALAAHVALVDHLLGQLDARLPRLHRNIDVQLWLADMPKTPLSNGHLERWARSTGHGVQHQVGAGLGERMAHALATVIESGSGAGRGYGLLIGSDCPTIDWSYLDKAASALEAGADVVLGPAEDGGYGLVGLSQPQPELFEDIAWGTDQVLVQTQAKAQRKQLNVQLLETLWDVDYLADWERFCRLYR